MRLDIGAGGPIFGLVGAVLTVPVLATLREPLRHALRKLQGLEPFPDEEEKEEAEHEKDRHLWSREFGQHLASRIHSFSQNLYESLTGEAGEQDIPTDND